MIAGGHQYYQDHECTVLHPLLVLAFGVVDDATFVGKAAHLLVDTLFTRTAVRPQQPVPSGPDAAPQPPRLPMMAASAVVGRPEHRQSCSGGDEQQHIFITMHDPLSSLPRIEVIS